MNSNPARLLSPFNHQHQSIIDYYPHSNVDQPVKDALNDIRLHFDESNDPAIVNLSDQELKLGVAVLVPYILDSLQTLILTSSNAARLVMRDALSGGRIDPYLVRHGFCSYLDFSRFIGPSVGNTIDEPTHAVIKQVDSGAMNDYPGDKFDVIIIFESRSFLKDDIIYLLEHFPQARRVFID